MRHLLVPKQAASSHLTPKLLTGSISLAQEKLLWEPTEKLCKDRMSPHNRQAMPRS